MNRLLIGIALLFSLSSFLSPSEFDDMEQLVVQRFNNYLTHTLHEKLYLHTDKPYYSAGEDIWLKGYLVNAALNTPTAMSNFMVVELVDQSDSVFERIKIKKDSAGFVGNFKLDQAIPPGYYALRAYTNWMQNMPEDFFFSKELYIGNAIADQITCELKYDGKENGEIEVQMTFKKSDYQPLAGKKVIIEKSWNRSEKKNPEQTTNEQGVIHFQVNQEAFDELNKYIDVSIDETDLKFRRKFYMPKKPDEFDVQFFPESGVLLHNVMQVVALKAIGSDGLSIEVKGEIYADNDELVAEFATSYQGMGKFVFTPLPERTYYAIVRRDDGTEKRIDLPKSEADGVALHLVNRSGRIFYQVNNSSGMKPQSLFIMAHVRGMVYVLQPLDETRSGQISESFFPPGIVTFSIINETGTVFCERLFFKAPDQTLQVNVAPERSTKRKRELVELDIAIQSAKGVPCKGDFSLSVTDRYHIKQDTLSDNILSYLLLSSDIRGYIENPASYFSADRSANRERLDLLMLTQGWRRFNTSDVLKGEVPQPEHFLEVSQVLSGKVSNLIGKPAKGCQVILYSDYKNMLRTTQTDSLGRYYFDGLEFPDSTSFLLRAESKSSLFDVELTPDSVVFNAPACFIPIPRREEEEVSEEYFELSKEKFFYEENIRQINLEEVKVTASAVKRELPQYYYTGAESDKISTEEIEDFHSPNVLDIISRLSGVTAYSREIIIRNYGAALILVDGIAVDIDFVRGLSTKDVAEVSVFKGANAAIFGSRGANGAIAIALKKGADRSGKAVEPVSIKRVMPMGYRVPEQFYVPKYDVESIRDNNIPDYRTTIYWEPNVSVDENGIAHVKFYAADQANDYDVILEGLTNDGKICRYSSVLKRD